MQHSTLLRRAGFAALAGLLASGVAACSSGAGADDDTSDGSSAVVLDPADLETGAILTKSPDGVTPKTLDDVRITDEECEEVRKAGFEVGVAMHFMSTSVPQNQVKGIKSTLAKCGVKVIGVSDAAFDSDQQTSDVENMIQQKPDGIISVPTDGTAMGPAYKKVQQAGIKLVLSDIFTQGLTAPEDYVSLVGSDIRSAGQIAGEVAAAYTPEDGTMAFVDFAIDFFATNERTAGAEAWVTENRPDIKQVTADFTDTAKVEQVAGDFLTANPNVDAMYTVWDAPGLQVLSAERAAGVQIPISTVDLGEEVALEMAKGGLVKGVGAQLPFEEGEAQAYVIMKAMLGDEVPEYVVTPAVPVVPANLTEGWKTVWHADPPAEIAAACKENPDCN